MTTRKVRCQCVTGCTLCDFTKYRTIPLDGVELITAERHRQIDEEGWDDKHDAKHQHGELARAAACYANPDPLCDVDDGVPVEWPWDLDWWKPKDRIRNLVRAGALIAAEIDRLTAAAAASSEGKA